MAESFNESLVNDWIYKKLRAENIDLAIAVADYINNSGVLSEIENMSTEQVKKTLSDITRKIIIESEGNDNSKVELIRKIGVSEPKKLDWNKLVSEKDIIPGQPTSADQRIKLASKYGYNSVEEFNDALSSARQEWASSQNAVMNNRINIQREYLYYLTLGDDARQKEMRKTFKNDKSLIAFFDEADKEMSGIRGWSAALARNVAQIGTGGSVVNKYAEDVLNANGGENENTLGGAFVDYPRQMLTDAAYGAATVAAAGPAMKLGATAAKLAGKPILNPIVTNATSGALQGGLEGARQLGAGEELDPAKMLIVGGSQATLPFLLEKAGTYLSKVPVLGRLISGTRRKVMTDPVSMKRQEISDTIDDLNSIIQKPELNQDALRVWAKDNRSELNDALIREGIDLKNVQDDITRTLSEYKKYQSSIRSLQRKLNKEQNTINLGEYSPETAERVKQYVVQLDELSRQKEAAKNHLNELRSSLKILESSQSEAGNKIVGEIQDEITSLQNVVNRSNDEIIHRGISMPSDIYNKAVRPEEQELYRLISRDVKGVTSEPGRFDGWADPIGYLSNNASRMGYENSAKPKYPDTREERWSKGMVRPDEEESQDYYDWCLSHPEFFSEVSE